MKPIGVVLAGGRGSRMQASKPAVQLGGEPLIARSLRALAEAGIEAVVMAKPGTQLPALACEVQHEPVQPHHPLLGVVTALRRHPGRAAIVLACDLPFAPAGLLAWLAAASQPLIVCEAQRRLHPLLGRYQPELAAKLGEVVERGEPAQAAVRALEPRVVGEDELRRFGDPERILFNVNTPEELARAEQLLEGPGRERGPAHPTQYDR